MKKLLAAIAGAMVVLPVAASAQSATDLAAQVQALLSQIAQLQQQLGTGTQTTVQPPPASWSGTPCPSLYRTLTIGAAGDDVVSLQLFLQARGYFSGNATGYFGPLTQFAVQRFQSTNGVVPGGTPATTGYGVVGGMTRAAINAVCSDPSYPTPSYPIPSYPIAPMTPSCPIAPPPTSSCPTQWQAVTDKNGCTLSYKCAVPLASANPTPSTCATIVLSCPAGKHDQVGPNCSHSCVDNTTGGAAGNLYAAPSGGGAPLAVTFTGNGSAGSGQALTLDYGDGQVDTTVSAIGTFTRSHIYTQNGIYTAQLRITYTGAVIGSAQISVGSMTTGTTGSITVSVSASQIKAGDGISIYWTTSGAPSGSAVALWLTDIAGMSRGLIVGGQGLNGNFTWFSPALNSQCPADSAAPCNIKADTYYITAKTYTPNNAYLGGFPPQYPVYPTYSATAQSNTFQITQ